MLWAIGTRSIAGLAMLVGTVYGLARNGLLRADYWQQLSPWVAFLAAIVAVLASATVLQFWRLDEKSEYYLRFGERLPFGGGGEVALLPGRGATLLVGHSPLFHVYDFPPAVQRTIFVATFLGVGLLTFDNRAVALLRELPDTFDRRSAEVCAEPAAPKVEEAVRPGCKLVERAYALGYTKSLGSCAPKVEEDDTLREVCRKRQHDEPYLHYELRLLEDGATAIVAGDDEGMVERLERQLDHLPALNAATLDAIGMAPRASHHVFTNLPDPSAARAWSERAAPDSHCADGLADLAHFPSLPEHTLLFGPSGRSELLRHVLSQLLFNPLYQPIVAQCQEVVVHWDAPDDACARLAADPLAFLQEHGAAEAVTGMIERRDRRAALAKLQAKAAEVPPVQRVVSLQCLIVDEAVSTSARAAVTAQPTTIAGATLSVREARVAPLGVDGASQIRLYKHAAELLAEGFGYGRLTSAQAVGTSSEEATTAASFRDPQSPKGPPGGQELLLTKLDLLRDADLFLGNEWLAERPDLLEVYPYHVHLENFVETFRRSYGQSRGRL